MDQNFLKYKLTISDQGEILIKLLTTPFVLLHRIKYFRIKGLCKMFNWSSILNFIPSLIVEFRHLTKLIGLEKELKWWDRKYVCLKDYLLRFLYPLNVKNKIISCILIPYIKRQKTKTLLRCLGLKKGFISYDWSPWKGTTPTDLALRLDGWLWTMVFMARDCKRLHGLC